MPQEPHERLVIARKEAGYPDPDGRRRAAAALGKPYSSYAKHENSGEGLRANAAEYARFFGVSLDWLMNNRGPMRPARRAGVEEREPTVPIVGYVGAGDFVNELAEEQFLGEIPAPPGSNARTRAVEIRGDSLGKFLDRWLAIYDDMRRPVTPDLVNRLCIVGLADGRILIKTIRRSGPRGPFHLVSEREDPIFDARIEWAAAVKGLVSR